MNARFRYRGFTLIELMVVITIIVVLLALLVPAMNKAVYQSQLAVCASQLRNFGSAITTYTLDNKRYYPDRGLDSMYNNNHHGLLTHHPSAPRWIDHRTVLRTVISDLNRALNDPLSGEVDLDNSQATYVWAPYALWYNFNYVVAGQPEQAMQRIGERWSWRQGTFYREFSVLVSDLDQVSPSLGEAQLSHPDFMHTSGITHNEVIQDAPSPWPLAAGTMTRSLWWSYEGTTHQRGPVDHNFAMADLSVQRIDRLGADSAPPDSRAVKVGAVSGYGFPPNRWNYVPAH